MNQMELRDGINTFASIISRQRIGLTFHRPEVWAEELRCFENAARKALQDGGRVQFGWTFQHRRVADIPGPGYLIATHHAVWLAPNGHLIDVTPYSDPRHHPLTPEVGSILFVVDDAARPIVNDKVMAPLPLQYFPLSDDPRLVAHVEQLRREEGDKCKEIYEGHQP